MNNPLYCLISSMVTQRLINDKRYVTIDKIRQYMCLNIITNYTHAPIPVVNEISSPTTYTDTDDHIALRYIIQFL